MTDLNSDIKHLNLILIYGTIYIKITECTFLSKAHIILGSLAALNTLPINLR